MLALVPAMGLRPALVHTPSVTVAHMRLPDDDRGNPRWMNGGWAEGVSRAAESLLGDERGPRGRYDDERYEEPYGRSRRYEDERRYSDSYANSAARRGVYFRIKRPRDPCCSLLFESQIPQLGTLAALSARDLPSASTRPRVLAAVGCLSSTPSASGLRSATRRSDVLVGTKSRGLRLQAACGKGRSRTRPLLGWSLACTTSRG